MGRRIWVVLVIWVVLAACGSSPGPALPLAQLRAEETRALCEYYVRCGVFGELDTCTAFFPPPDDRSLFAAVEAGKVRYDDAAAVRCRDEMAARSCDATTREGRVPLVCNEVFVGRVATGGKCGFDLECTSGLCLLPGCPPGACCPGTCEPGERNPIGTPCQSDLQCELESFCGPDRTCIALLAAGGRCKSDGQCAYGLGCVGKTELMDGTCARLPLLDEPCPDNRCAEIGARCDENETCVPVGLVGAQCDTDAECSRFLECGPAGSCIDTPGAGEDCTRQCAGETFCARDTTNTCTPLQEDGAFCEVAEQCAGGLCLEGPFAAQCATPPICF
jgi:hypothetical protein